MDKYSKLSDQGDDSDSSDNSIGQPPSFRVLEKHGHTVQEEYEQGVSGKACLTNKDGVSYVVKEINCRDKKSLQTVKKEVKILQSLKHGYIVSYVDSFEDKESGFMYIVMEYCSGGDLCKRMQKQIGFFEENEILDWLVQICLALQYIHEKNVLHRDIKPQNIFLTEDGYINLGDFGCSKILERADEYAASVVGAELYRSPEVFKKKYEYKSDIWSLGWLLHDLCMLDVWSDKMERCILHALSMRGNPPPISEIYSEDLRELIKEMLSCDPTHRPSADEILAKPFLKDAVNRNSKIPDDLEQSLINSIKSFDKAYNKHFKNFENLVSEWGKTTDSLEKIHYGTTAGSLSGAVIGTAGGITAVVGAVLAPFTAGASLIVTGVGVGVSFAGGVTGAASNITNTVKQKSLHESFKQFKQKYENVSELIHCSLRVRELLVKCHKFSDFASSSPSDKVQMQWEIGKSTVDFVTGIISLGVLGNFIRIAAQAAKISRAAVVASGVLGGLLVIADVTFMVKDSIEIHEMRQKWKTDDPEKVKSRVFKVIVQMRKMHTGLLNVLEEIKKLKEVMKKTENQPGMKETR